jgi:hypothetical protein
MPPGYGVTDKQRIIDSEQYECTRIITTGQVTSSCDFTIVCSEHKSGDHFILHLELIDKKQFHIIKHSAAGRLDMTNVVSSF